MHLIELGLGNYSLINAHTPGCMSITIRPGVHGKQIGTVSVEMSEGTLPGDTVISFASKDSIQGFIDCLQEVLNRLNAEEDSADDEDCDCEACNGCRGESSSEPFEVPAHATGSDENGLYRLIKLQSMPEKWSHLRMHQNGDTIVINNDFTEREATVNEVLGVMIFVASGRWSYIDQPVKSEYPKYVIDRGRWDDVAYIEQTGEYEWVCVMKNRTQAEMMPGLPRRLKAVVFETFINDGSWRYVTKAEAVSRLESQS